LLDVYKEDLNEDFVDELMQFKTIVDDGETPLCMFLKLEQENLKLAFPNIETALRIFLTIPVSNCSGERSFSLLKRLKSNLRSTMKQDKLSNLSILAIESDITEKLNYEDIITEFAEKRPRKKIIQF